MLSAVRDPMLKSGAGAAWVDPFERNSKAYRFITPLHAALDPAAANQSSICWPDRTARPAAARPAEPADMSAAKGRARISACMGGRSSMWR
jgi:hypothetical protein